MAMIMTPFAHLFGSKISFQNQNGLAKYALVWKHDSHSSIGIFAIPCPFWNDQTNITLATYGEERSSATVLVQAPQGQETSLKKYKKTFSYHTESPASMAHAGLQLAWQYSALGHSQAPRHITQGLVRSMPATSIADLLYKRPILLQA